ncbi:hypothetical protein [Flavobacterium sp. TSSA_36]|uniref:hypothetical protein n=1 Tax=Flavobacterium sp. TSSA_36 TaxID=3447669 RepID=UPI003F383707
MKKYCFLLICILLNFKIQAQKIEFFSDANFGIPSAKSLKIFHDELVQQANFENFKTKENFNNYYGFTCGLRYNSNLSVFYSNKVTGAKSSVADYSGYVRLTNELSGHTLGLIYQKKINPQEKGSLMVSFKSFVTKSILKLKSQSTILNVTEESQIDFKSIDFGVAAGVAYEYDLHFVILRAYVDLEAYAYGKLKIKEGDFKDGHLTNAEGEKVITGWSGVATGLGVSIPILK